MVLFTQFQRKHLNGFQLFGNHHAPHRLESPSFPLYYIHQIIFQLGYYLNHLQSYCSSETINQIYFCPEDYYFVQAHTVSNYLDGEYEVKFSQFCKCVQLSTAEKRATVFNFSIFFCFLDHSTT